MNQCWKTSHTVKYHIDLIFAASIY